MYSDFIARFIKCNIYTRIGTSYCYSSAFMKCNIYTCTGTSYCYSSATKNKISSIYPATTITDDDYTDDIAILANTPDQAETLLHSLERAAASIGLHVNAHKTEYMCYNQTGDISTLEGTPLKLVDKFTYLGSSVESTEKDIETRLTKAWTAINRLSTIWKSDLTDKMKRSFFQGSGHIDTAIWMHYMDANKTAGEETRWQLHKNAACNPEQVLAATPHKTPTVRPPAPYHENYSS